MTVKPFTVRVDDDVLVDLGKRLDATRFPSPIDGAGWSYYPGVEVANRHIFHSLMTERRAFYW